MRIFGVSANLMSLGAIDFGIVVDGSIVILEGILAHIYGKKFVGKKFSKEEMDAEVEKGAGQVVRSATFAVLIILIVFFPILTLTGIEGKYFTPMAKTLVFCIIGALLLSLTYVPMMASLFLNRSISDKPTLADKFFDGLNKIYAKTLGFCLKHIWGTIAASFIALLLSLGLFTKLGAEFIHTSRKASSTTMERAGSCLHSWPQPSTATTASVTSSSSIPPPKPNETSSARFTRSIGKT